jgi:hypothetical protein
MGGSMVGIKDSMERKPNIEPHAYQLKIVSLASLVS